MINKNIGFDRKGRLIKTRQNKRVKATPWLKEQIIRIYALPIDKRYKIFLYVTLNRNKV